MSTSMLYMSMFLDGYAEKRQEFFQSKDTNHYGNDYCS